MRPRTHRARGLGTGGTLPPSNSGRGGTRQVPLRVVACPDCGAQAGQGCLVIGTDKPSQNVHAVRRRLALRHDNAKREAAQLQRPRHEIDAPPEGVPIHGETPGGRILCEVQPLGLGLGVDVVSTDDPDAVTCSVCRSSPRFPPD